MKDLQASSQSMDDYFSEDLVIMKQLSDWSREFIPDRYIVAYLSQ